ncbi:hypothetical protein BGZ60DRAFT_419748 [Tricladium varicosporioides]|nr:hypothetical protein BGZ60DRAFT_419748 [Hymenoscyphus varicosporioides]
MSTTGNCTAVSKLPLQDPSWPYYWNIGNNMAFVVQTKQGDCPTRDAQIVVGNINTLDADVYAYMDAGVAVHRSALGVPRSVYSAERVFAPEFHSVLDAFGNSIVATRQCSRVMARNPISCHRGGKIVWKRPWFNISADDGLCDESQLYTTDSWDHYNNAGGGAMIKTMCPHHEIGQGTMVIGASGGYAHWLAVALDDTANAPKAAVGSTYAITCTVDARSVFEYREVSLLLQNRDASQSRYMRFLNATDTTCTGPPIIRDVIATAASANWQTFLQQAGADGWFDLVWEASNRAHASRTSPFGFAESKNPLEDVLGLVSAMVTARMNSSTFHEINSTAAVLAARVGDGRYASIAFALPPLLVVLILSGLIIEMLMRDVPTVDCTQLEQLINLR